MAQEDQAGASDKGKGKVDDVRDLQEDKKDVKDTKLTLNGKKDEEPKEGMQQNSSRRLLSSTFLMLTW